MTSNFRICAVPREKSHKLRGDECRERESHFAHGLLVPRFMRRRYVEMDGLPNEQPDGNDTALIDRPSASSGDIWVPRAFRSTIAAVQDKHGDCGTLSLERMFRVCVLSC